MMLAISVMVNVVPVSWGAEQGFEFFEEEAKVAIATQREQKLEEAPSIVSVITRDEIERYGARDLTDILRTVPGFEYGVDVYSEAGVSFRGIWVHEGKSLLMINGVTQNELGFGNYTFLGTIPASMIEKVEIIRGPGSALYGGFAEIDTINVITHQAENLNGMRVSADVGAVGKGGASRHGNISFGSETDNLKVAVHVGRGTQVLSKRDYSDFFGNTIHLDQVNAFRNWQHVITEASSKNLTLRYQRTSFTFGGQDTFTTIQPPVNGAYLEETNNYNDVTHIDYQAKITDRLTLKPLFEYTRNNSWNFNYPASIDGFYEGSGAWMSRTRGELTANYGAPWNGDLMLGGGYIRDGAYNIASDGTPGIQLSENPADLGNRKYTSTQFGLFQYQQKLSLFGITVGGRYEDTSFGSAFAPRAGLTYVNGAFNTKLLYGRAFRIPLPWQAYSKVLTFNGDLKPEVADTTELEVGYKFTRHMVGKINTFFIDIKDPLVYTGTNNRYQNFGDIESEGVEAELRATYSQFGGFANISYSRPGTHTSPGFVTKSGKQFLASPPVKINLGTYYRTGIMEFSPSVTYLSHRAGQSIESANDPGGALGTTGYDALFIANLNIVARDVVKDFDVHLAVHNIFDSRYVLIQPYYGAHAPMPAEDREIDLGVTWHL
jgi:outer membrane cobalamin receptor